MKEYSRRFVAFVWVGSKVSKVPKPKNLKPNLDQIFVDFVNELNHLTTSGLVLGENTVFISIVHAICDGPAKVGVGSFKNSPHYSYSFFVFYRHTFAVSKHMQVT